MLTHASVLFVNDELVFGVGLSKAGSRAECRFSKELGVDTM